MKRTLIDIRENLPFVGCDNDTALELCARVEELEAELRRRDAIEAVMDGDEASIEERIKELREALAGLR